MIDLQIIRCTVMNCNQIFQTFLDSLCIHSASTGEFYPVTKCDLYGCIIHKFIICCQPRLYFHIVIIFKKSLANTITKSTPARIIVMRIQTCITHFFTVSGCSIDKRFSSVCPYTCCHSCCKHSSCKNCCDQFLLHDLYFLSTF